MLMTPAVKQCRRLKISFLLLLIGLVAASALGGGYRESGHGNATYGVNRTTLDGKFANYAVGNCAHCHEMHASLEGVEPAPSAGPAPHTLFADSFNASRTQNPYQESDNFCFNCHSDSSGQQVFNRSYSATFGGGNFAAGPQSIMAAFNQLSYHNLNDIRTFLTTDSTYSSWFANLGNPCSACHDSHLAKRNWDGLQPGFPLLSTISKPGGAGIRTLWGEGSQVMSAYLSYEAPYSSGNTLREPADVGVANGDNTPDYVNFCTSCHNEDTSITSTTLGRELKKINWDSIGLNQDKHGDLSRDGNNSLREPYTTAAASKSNFVLSCLDCHEPHGSVNIMMLRSRINGEDLEGLVSSTDTMSYACKRCHTDDLAAAAGTGEADRWEYIHHLAPDAPYAKSGCSSCHGAGAGNSPVPCGNCHGHGMNDSWAPVQASGRKTF